jgi:flavorubredoxin
VLELLSPEAHPIATDTYLLPTLAPEPSGGFVSAHTMVIRGAEPVVVDTGCSLARDLWLERLTSVVEPADVRWIFLSHDDHDHIGNLDAVLEACPEAVLVGNWSMTTRLAGDVPLPVERMRWLDGGGSFDAGDRTLHLVRPPLFDSPATRGLFDDRTGVLWAVDTFGALVQGPVLEADDADPELHDATFDPMNAWNTPWLELVDTARFREHLRQTASLPITAVASAHGPILRGERIADAFERTAALAARPVPPTPGQAMLDELLAAFAVPAPTATSAA